MAFNPEAMDHAADLAKADLRELLKQLPAEQRKGAAAVFRWLRDHYKTAGYKRLCRFIVFDLNGGEAAES